MAELPADETTLEVAVEAASAAPDGGISTGFKGGRETIVPPVCRLLLPGAFVMMKTVALDEATIDGGFEFERQVGDGALSTKYLSYCPLVYENHNLRIQYVVIY